MIVYPFVLDPAFLINLYASFFWFGTIFSEERACCFNLILFHVCGLCVQTPFCVVA